MTDAITKRVSSPLDAAMHELAAQADTIAAIRAELDEMNALAELMATEVRAARALAWKATRERDACWHVTEQLLQHRQLEQAVLRELLADITQHPLDERTKTLVANAERALQGS